MQKILLLEDDAAVGLGPVPGVDEELLAGEVGFLDALRGELGDDLGLGCDRGMVGAGHPEGDSDAKPFLPEQKITGESSCSFEAFSSISSSKTSSGTS